MLRILVVTLFLFPLGCGGKKIEPKPEKQYGVSYSKLPPPPVYNRLRWGHPPAPIPPDPNITTGLPAVYPIVNLDVKNTSLEEVGMILAAVTHYSSFTSSEIANRQITVNLVGTLEEISTLIANSAHIEVSIDHERREIRFTGTGNSGLAGE